MARKIFLEAIVIILSFQILSFSAKEKQYTPCTMPNVLQQMQYPEFWVKKSNRKNKVILTSNQIKSFNEKSMQTKGTHLCDLCKYPDNLTSEQLTSRLNELNFPDSDRYLNRVKLDSSYYDNLRNNMNYEFVKEQNIVPYAIATMRTSIRSFPTDDIVLSEPDDIEFDMFQESVAVYAEPLRIMHKSKDNEWYFVQSGNCIGWVRQKDVAIAKNKDQWLKLAVPNEFLVVTSNKIILPYNPYSKQLSGIEINMGTSLALAREEDAHKHIDNQFAAGSYVVELPLRTESGELIFKPCLIPVNDNVSVGYLKYTVPNVIRQTFKAQGDRYGWGGMFGSRDCSSFVVDVFKCFGILLPRNTSSQVYIACKTTNLEGMDINQKQEQLHQALPGSLLLMNGHVMLYLGYHDKRFYMIHASYSYGEAVGSDLKDSTVIINDFSSVKDVSMGISETKVNKVIVNSVTVSDLSNFRKNKNITFMESITMIKQIV